jgi:hypothetical protein
VRWVVIEGTPEFFAVIKRIHNWLHWAPGDGGPLDDDARSVMKPRWPTTCATSSTESAVLAGVVRLGRPRSSSDRSDPADDRRVLSQRMRPWTATRSWVYSAPPGCAPTVQLVSRRDTLNDPLGVIRGFADYVPGSTNAHLIFAGQAESAVADHPEGRRVSAKRLRYGRTCPRKPGVGAGLAADGGPGGERHIVNALQRDATVLGPVRPPEVGGSSHW